MDGDLFAVEGVDELYTLDPSAFVAERTQLVRALKAAKNKEAASAVAKLARPTVVAWAVNQVVRRDPAAIERLVEATATVREAQAEAVRGGDASALRKAGQERRDAIQSLADAAAEIAGASNRDGAAGTFDAASLDPSLVEVLRAGRLSKALEPESSFGLAGMPDPPDRAEEADAHPRERVDPGHDAAAARAAEALKAAEAELAESEVCVRSADAQLDAALRELERARAERDRARTKRDEARSSLARTIGSIRTLDE